MSKDFQVYERQSVYSNVDGKEKRLDTAHYRDPKTQKDAYYRGTTDPSQNVFREELGKSRNRKPFQVQHRQHGNVTKQSIKPFSDVETYFKNLRKKYFHQKPIKVSRFEPVHNYHPTSKELEIFNEFEKRKRESLALKLKTPISGEPFFEDLFPSKDQ